MRTGISVRSGGQKMRLRNILTVICGFLIGMSVFAASETNQQAARMTVDQQMAWIHKLIEEKLDAG